MNSVTILLIELQSLEEGLEKRLSASQRTDVANQVAKVRGQIPITIQGHYDRLRAVGKKPMAAVVNGACQGCFLSLPYGDILRMRTSDDIHLCEHCGRYIYLKDESPATEEPSKADPPKPRKGDRATPSSKSKTRRKTR